MFAGVCPHDMEKEFLKKHLKLIFTIDEEKSFKPYFYQLISK